MFTLICGHKIPWEPGELFIWDVIQGYISCPVCGLTHKAVLLRLAIEERNKAMNTLDKLQNENAGSFAWRSHVEQVITRIWSDAVTTSDTLDAEYRKENYNQQWAQYLDGKIFASLKAIAMLLGEDVAVVERRFNDHIVERMMGRDDV